MNIKLLLSGILLLSILAACSDRYEEENSYEEPSVSSHTFKRGEQTKEAAKVSDSTKSKEIINAPQPIPTDASAQQGATDTGETIDPTKPDRPK